MAEVIITKQGVGDKHDRLMTRMDVQREIRRERHNGNQNMLVAVRDQESGLYRLFEQKA